MDLPKQVKLIHNGSVPEPEIIGIKMSQLMDSF